MTTVLGAPLEAVIVVVTRLGAGVADVSDEGSAKFDDDRASVEEVESEFEDCELWRPCELWEADDRAADEGNDDG